MNHLIEKTVTVAYDITNPADRFTLIGEYMKEGATFIVDYAVGKDEKGLNRAFTATLLKNGAAVAVFTGEGYEVGRVPENFVLEYNKAVAEGLDSIRPVTEEVVTKKSKAVTAGASGSRGKLSQAQKDEIAAMSRDGLTAEQIGAKVGRAAETVAKYMEVKNPTPVGAMAEEEATGEDEDFEGAEDALEAEDEEEDAEAVILS